MSRESALGFMVKVMKEPELAQEVRKLNAKDLPGLVKVAEREGFTDFNQDDYYFAADKVGGEWSTWAGRMRGTGSSDEISDADLEHLAGGKGASDVFSGGGSVCMVSGMVTEPNWCNC